MTKVIAEGITTWPADPVELIGSRCAACGHSTFPTQQWCPQCGAPDMAEVHLPRSGTVVAWTTQGFYPGPGYITSPEQFVPFAMGLVQLGDQIRVEGRLTESDPANLRFGMAVELTMVPVATDESGDEILTFAFQPV